MREDWFTSSSAATNEVVSEKNVGVPGVPQGGQARDDARHGVRLPRCIGGAARKHVGAMAVKMVTWRSRYRSTLTAKTTARSKCCFMKKLFLLREQYDASSGTTTLGWAWHCLLGATLVELKARCGAGRHGAQRLLTILGGWVRLSSDLAVRARRPERLSQRRAPWRPAPPACLQLYQFATSRQLPGPPRAWWSLDEALYCLGRRKHFS